MKAERECRPLSNRKTVLVRNLTLIKLYENDSIIISSTPTQFENIMSKWLIEHSLDQDKRLLQLVVESCEDGAAIVDCKEVIEHCNLGMRLYFAIARLLENGCCHIFNKKTKSYVEEIETDTYGFMIADLMGRGGRVFYLPRKQFYETEKGIS